MKLIDIKPIIFENSADNIFAEPAMSNQELMKYLRKKEIALKHQWERVGEDRASIIPSIPGWMPRHNYPGGSVVAMNDVAAGRVLVIGSNNTIIPNTPENVLKRERYVNLCIRREDLSELISKTHQRMLRTRGKIKKETKLYTVGGKNL